MTNSLSDEQSDFECFRGPYLSVDNEANLSDSSSQIEIMNNPSRDELWLVSPPPCFTARPVEIKTGSMEDLLIEHPSMSVYNLRSRPPLHARSRCNDDCSGRLGQPTGAQRAIVHGSQVQEWNSESESSSLERSISRRRHGNGSSEILQNELDDDEQFDDVIADDRHQLLEDEVEVRRGQPRHSLIRKCQVRRQTNLTRASLERINKASQPKRLRKNFKTCNTAQQFDKPCA